jgi:DNA polymerase III subunit epsilon
MSDFDGFVVFDLETTGISPAKHHRIIEIGIVRLDEIFEVIESWETLINPQRDIGPTSIHGLTASDLAEAPSFGDVIADIWHRFEGAVPVSHNFTFDRSFLLSEFKRYNIDLHDFDGLCTLRLVNQLRIASGRRCLSDICRALSIPLTEAHSAGHDAKACADILKAIATKTELPELKKPVRCPELWKRNATPLGVTRQKARERVVWSPLQILAERIGAQHIGVPVDITALDEYLLILDRVLEDRVVEEGEAEELAAIATEKGFSCDDITKVHERYLGGLLAVALCDGILTADEKRDLTRVAGLLGISAAKLESMLLENPSATAFASEVLTGKSVCFTGELRCRIDGDPIDRKSAEAIACRAGLIPKSSVTKQLDLLVVADPDTLSGKAKKARQYGTRILSERAFWQKLGVQAD